ncbi:hypothetical protein MPH_12573 [Macrophomina phaseolina MS6]|uniref:Nudix hydrolase domain-containing protein n=2 Tax=Macrophomina phaseolina TaxID=35725 RepID=K2R7J1_MACPH|nr:hypothetical protein MPH_12573 [Macrophomina phaseolina MS6]KAH7053070.1 NUDIX hydrolase domain-like protein [Macrophomina phaseolina]
MSPLPEKVPRVGVGVFILNDKGHFIVGQRKGSHGSGTWALPGGHLEFGETFETCAARETLEETGLETSDVRFLTATNNIMTDDNAHYVTIFMTAKISGEKVEPELLEPEKCEEWRWISWDELRTWVEKSKAGQEDAPRLFLPLLDLFAQRPGLSPVQKA